MILDILTCDGRLQQLYKGAFSPFLHVGRRGFLLATIGNGQLGEVNLL